MWDKSNGFCVNMIHFIFFFGIVYLPFYLHDASWTTWSPSLDDDYTWLMTLGSFGGWQRGYYLTCMEAIPIIWGSSFVTPRRMLDDLITWLRSWDPTRTYGHDLEDNWLMGCFTFWGGCCPFYWGCCTWRDDVSTLHELWHLLEMVCYPLMMRHCTRSMGVSPLWCLHSFDKMLGFSLRTKCTFDDVIPFGGFEAPMEMECCTLSWKCFTFWSIYFTFWVSHPLIEATRATRVRCKPLLSGTISILS